MSTKLSFAGKLAALASVAILVAVTASTTAAQSVRVLERSEAKPLIPTSFKFEGESAGTQMRNSSAASFGRNRHVAVGLVDNSGYSTDAAKEYEGFFITGLAVRVGGVRLAKGSYAFGFLKNGTVKFRSSTGKASAVASTKKDTDLKRPRPLMLTVVNGELRFYKGREYVVVKAD
ncbi:MAG TPA: hypothetical protein VMM38_12175 [Aridibacter sp.]|nr:hypothetical protein [Aridibacter sp.]